MFVGIHTLTTLVGVPNRDRYGRPKTIMLGGYRRQRISSQAQTRVARLNLAAAFEDLKDRIDLRSRHLPSQVVQYLDPERIDDEARLAIMEAVGRIGAKDRSPTAEAEEEQPDDEEGIVEREDEVQAPPEAATTAQLILFTPREARVIAQALTESVRKHGIDAFRKLSRANILEEIRVVHEPFGVSTALFGRMTTASPLQNVDAAVYRAHRIGVHRLDDDTDFYTAVDDLTGETAYLDRSGQGVAFGATLYYGYEAIDMRQLTKNLQGDTGLAHRALIAFLRASLMATPVGMRTRFGQSARPSFVVLEVLPNGEQPNNAVEAFLTPVRGSMDTPIGHAARNALIAYLQQSARMYDMLVARAYIAPENLSPGTLRHSHSSDTNAVDGDDTNAPDAVYCPSINRLADWLSRQLEA